MKLLIVFIIANLLNVSLSTAKSIITIKGGKVISAVVSAGYYAFYTWVLVLTMCDLEMYQKMIIVGGCNLIGVFVVKLIEQKIQKDKLWKVELTVPTQHVDEIDLILDEIPHSYIRLSDKHTVFNFYCATQKESGKVKTICEQYGGKYFAAESKIL